MRFGKQLRYLAYAPWKEQHINYKMLKQAIKRMLAIARMQNRTVVVDKAAAAKQREEQEHQQNASQEALLTAPLR